MVLGDTDPVEAEFVGAPQSFRDSVRWLPIGDAVSL